MKRIKKTTVFFLILCVLISLILSLFKFGDVPACLNADEAAFGYNALAILKTGKDEYGNFLPMRLKSFGDFKLPLYSYLSVPAIAFFGLTEFSTRLLAIVLGAIFPLVIYFLSKEVFEDDRVSIVAAFFTSLSPWLHIFSRQAHEVVLASFWLSLFFIFFIRFVKRRFAIDFILMTIFSGLSLFSYHISRIPILAIYFFIIYYLFKQSKFDKKKSLIYIIFFSLPTLFFLYGDIKYNPSRLNNLVFYKNQGFSLKINELRSEHDSRFIHNKLSQAFLDLPKEYLKYFSPQFLVIGAEENPRFGYDGISPLTITEYLLLFIGIYYIFKKREQYRYFILFLFIVSPMSASLAWQSYSLSRAFYLLIPILLTLSFGLVSIAESFKKHTKITTSIIIALYIVLNFYSWDFYFYHYPKRARVIRSWQCGYKEVFKFINDNYDKFDRFVISDRLGQPYIFALFHLGFKPNIYQIQANLSDSDEYGFGQVLKFDKFYFKFSWDNKLTRTLFVGFPEDFEGVQIDEKKLKKIRIGSEDIFYLYET